MKRVRTWPRLRLGLVAALLAGATLAAAVTDAPSVEGIKLWVEGSGLAAPVSFLLLYVVLTVLFFPGSVLTGVGGALFGAAWGTVLSVLGRPLVRPQLAQGPSHRRLADENPGGDLGAAPFAVAAWERECYEAFGTADLPCSCGWVTELRPAPRADPQALRFDALPWGHRGAYTVPVEATANLTTPWRDRSEAAL